MRKEGIMGLIAAPQLLRSRFHPIEVAGIPEWL
jgi:hypothetical protein